MLADPGFYRIVMSECDGKLASGPELSLIELPPKLKEQVQAVHKAASQEMSAE